MTVSLGRNISALNVQRSLDQSSLAVARTFERLSSGLRINRAADDAAGLSVASSLDHRARVFSRANLNVSDAISLTNVADSALQQVSGILTRMAELAYQAANGTFSSTQRKTLETEYRQLDLEIRRMSASTTFNRLGLLEGQRSSRSAYASFNLSAEGTPQVSVDGRYATAIDASGVLYRVDADTGTQIAITDGVQYSAAQSYALQNGDVLFLDSNTAEVYRWSSDSGSIQSLTSNSAGSSMISTFTASADGSTIAFVSDAAFVDGGTLSDRGPAHPGYQVWTMNLSEGRVRQIQSPLATAAASDASLRLSADGSYVAFADPGLSGLVVANTTGSTITAVAQNSTSGQVYGVSNAGTAYFRSAISALNQVVSLSHSTGSFRQLTSFSSLTNISSATLSGDGSRLFFISTSNLSGESSIGGRQVYEFNTSSQGFRSLTQMSGISLATATISEDGNRLFLNNSGTVQVFDTSAESTNIDFEAGFGALGRINGSIDALTQSIRGLGALGLTSQLAAQVALDRMRSNLSTLNAARGDLGALLSRLSTAQSTLRDQRDEFVAASSRIKDADIASESAQLARLSILQRTGNAVLAQARVAPQIALQLLGLS